MRVARPMDGTAATCPPDCGYERSHPDALVERMSAGRLRPTTPGTRVSLDQGGSGAEFPAEADEKGLQRERRAEVELFERAPGLADDLAGPLRGLARFEFRIRIDRARDLEQRLAALGRLRIEQPRGAVEPPRREPRERRSLRGLETGRACGDLLPDRAFRQAAERHELAARAD